AGLFIKTQRGFRPGTVLEMEITLPDDSVTKLKGRVIRTIKTSESAIKNGMGIEIIDADERYLAFLDSRFDDIKPAEAGQDSETKPAYLIMRCKKCGVKNRVDKSKLRLHPKCGSCKSPL
ncbi:MAG: PilZ domain-containing protein, partial [Thermodesulfovibrionales bacterium]